MRSAGAGLVRRAPRHNHLRLTRIMQSLKTLELDGLWP